MNTWLETLFHSPTAQLKLGLFAASCIVLLLLRRLLLKLIWQHFEDIRTRYVWRRNINTVLVLCAAFMAAGLLLEVGPSFVTYLGLLSAGMAVALNEPLSNLVGWIFIAWRRPFVFGDRIAIAGVAGDVVDIRLFQFTLLEIGNWVAADQSTGRVVHIPNSRIFKEAVFNYTDDFPYIWNEIPVTLTFESNWRKAKHLMQHIADTQVSSVGAQAAQEERKAYKHAMIAYGVLTPAVYTSVAEYGVRLTLRYLCPPRRRRGTSHQLWEAILDAFAEHPDVAFAYPTQRFFDQRTEGKPGPYPAPPTGEMLAGSPTDGIPQNCNENATKIQPERDQKA